MSSQSLASPDAVKAMSFRTTMGQHERMAKVAKQEEMSLNAWMNKVLEEAVTAVSSSLYDFPPPKTDAIRGLIEDPDNNIELVGRLIGLLEDRSHKAVLRFSNALIKYLSGLDAIWPYWHAAAQPSLEPDPGPSAIPIMGNSFNGLTLLTQGLALPLRELSDPTNAEDVIEINDALNLYVAGLSAIVPYLSDTSGVKTVEFLNLIQASIQEIESQGRLEIQEDEGELDSLAATPSNIMAKIK